MSKRLTFMSVILWTICCAHAVEENSNKYVPGWIQYLTSVGNNRDNVKEDLESLESKFDMIKPITPKPHHPVLSKFYVADAASFLKMPLITFYGSGELNGLVFQGDIRSYGPLQLTHVDVTKLYVEGVLNAQDLTVSELQARGDARLSQAHILGPTTILGELNASGSIFKNAIHLKGAKLVLSKCDLQGNLHVESNQPSTPQPRIYLTKGTHIQGDIKCDGACDVFLEPGCKIHGKVFNAVIKKLPAAS